MNLPSVDLQIKILPTNTPFLTNDLEYILVKKDLWVTIDEELQFKEHVVRKVRVANRIVGDRSDKASCFSMLKLVARKCGDKSEEICEWTLMTWITQRD